MIRPYGNTFLKFQSSLRLYQMPLFFDDENPYAKLFFHSAALCGCPRIEQISSTQIASKIASMKCPKWKRALREQSVTTFLCPWCQDRYTIAVKFPAGGRDVLIVTRYIDLSKTANSASTLML
jgi:uncharacterized protein YlaI